MTFTSTDSSPDPAVSIGPRPRWALLGTLFGLLGVAAIALYGPIGVSGTFPRVVGELLRVAMPATAAANPYLAKVGGALVPETMLVIGLFLGGVIAARVGQRARPPAVEYIHGAVTTRRRRNAEAFAGGFLILFGARLAGGCTSGHIISGITQMAVSGLLFGGAVFAAGIATAKLMRRRAAAREV